MGKWMGSGRRQQWTGKSSFSMSWCSCGLHTHSQLMSCARGLSGWWTFLRTVFAFSLSLDVLIISQQINNTRNNWVEDPRFKCYQYHQVVTSLMKFWLLLNVLQVLGFWFLKGSTELNNRFVIGCSRNSDIFCFLFVHFSCMESSLHFLSKIRFALYF